MRQVAGVARDLPHRLGRCVDLHRALGARHPGAVLPLVQPFHQTARSGATRTSAPALGEMLRAIAPTVLPPDPTSPSTKNDPRPWIIAPTMSRARHAEGVSTVSATGASRSALASASVSAGTAAYRAVGSARHRTGTTASPRSPEIASAPLPSRPIAIATSRGRGSKGSLPEEERRNVGCDTTSPPHRPRPSCTPPSSTRATRSRSIPTKTRPGGVHANGTCRASKAYPAKNRAFFRLKPAVARAIDVAPATAAPHVRVSSASYVFTVPVNVTASSPCLINPAVVGSTRHARALTDPREVVSHNRAPLYANTSGVQCGPFGVAAAAAT